MFFSPAEIIAWIIAYKYILLVPIAFVEGHIISFIVGFLARLGYLNPFLGGALVASGNLLGDIALYFLGFYKGEKVARSWGKYIGVTDASIEKVRHIFHRHKSYILFISKISNGFGLAMAVLFTAGFMKIPFKTYLLWNILGECVWTSCLVAFGFYFGHLYTTVETIGFRIGLVAIGVTVIFVVFRIRKTLKTRIEQEEAECPVK